MGSPSPDRTRTAQIPKGPCLWVIPKAITTFLVLNVNLKGSKFEGIYCKYNDIQHSKITPHPPPPPGGRHPQYKGFVNSDKLIMCLSPLQKSNSCFIRLESLDRLTYLFVTARYLYLVLSLPQTAHLYILLAICIKDILSRFVFY